MNCEQVDISNQPMDESGYYILIKVDFATRQIGLRIMDSNEQIIEDFWGVQCQDVYCKVLDDERAKEWFTNLKHIAYLGKELKKAEIALATGGSYYQE